MEADEIERVVEIIAKNVENTGLKFCLEMHTRMVQEGYSQFSIANLEINRGLVEVLVKSIRENEEVKEIIQENRKYEDYYSGV